MGEPLAFFDGHACGTKVYTNGADREKIVAPKFCEATFELLGGVRVLNFGRLGWGSSEFEALAVVLPLCGQLNKLQLHENPCGDAGVAAIARAIASMANLVKLFLGNNQISDAGVISLSEAIGKGSMGALR